MADGTHIEWTDATWNPITGCSVVSAGCKHCYAMKLAGTRLKHDPSRQGLTIDTAAGPVWNGQVRFNEQWLDQPLRWKRPRRIFVCAHGDLFHENVPDEWIDRVFDVMETARRNKWLGEHRGWGWEDGHTFQVLTKRPGRMLQYLRARQAKKQAYADQFKGCPTEDMRNSPAAMLARQNAAAVPPHIWLGVSVENQAATDERIPLLLQCPAAVRWISAEPLLGPIDLRWAFPDIRTACCHRCGFRTNSVGGTCPNDGETLRGDIGVDWVVAGGESGPGARPMSPDWARSLRDQCAAAGVPFLFKQWGEWLPMLGQAASVPVREKSTTADGWVMGRAGKKAAGRHLDGVLHDGYPGVRP